MKNKKKSDTFPPPVFLESTKMPKLVENSPAKNPEKYSEAETSKRKVFFPNSLLAQALAQQFVLLDRVLPT